MRIVGLLIAIVLVTGCASRKPLEFSGTLKLYDNVPIPAGYVLVLREVRRDWALTTVDLAVGIIRPDPDGRFSFSGPVCPDLFLFVPNMASHGIRGQREDPIWTSPLRIELSAAETKSVLSWRSGPFPDAAESSAQSELDKLNRAIEKYGGLQNVPC